MLHCARLRVPKVPVLVELVVENYAVIDRVAAEFAPGLNLLTGETGAGKSILIDALALLLGERASPDIIRHGAEKAVLSAVFETESPHIAPLLEGHGIDGNDGQVLLRREILSGGKGRVFVNNQPATVALLRQLAPLLASIHAQNETLGAFDGTVRRGLLDAFAGCSTAALEQAYERWRQARQRLEEIEQDEQERLRLLDLWTFQKKEIEQAGLEPGEDERLEAEKRILANAEKLYAAAISAYEQLYEGTGAAAASLRGVGRNVELLAQYESSFQEAARRLEEARLDTEEIAASLRDYAERMDFSPERRAQVEDRLAVLDLLKRKYGPGLQEVIAHGEDVSRKLAEMENRDLTLARLGKEVAAAAEGYLSEAQAVSRARREASRRLEKQAGHEINQLAMKAAFRVEVTSGEGEDHWTAAGIDTVEYLVATNPGEPLKPLAQIASGGELSRVILALKATVEAAGTGRGQRRRGGGPPRTLVFDEVDTGIGGSAAEAVGRKLKSLAGNNQVLCVTHLPQIASFADHHLRVTKSEQSGRTHTEIRVLEAAERKEEIARMLSGARTTEASRKHAEQMLRANA